MNTPQLDLFQAFDAANNIYASILQAIVDSTFTGLSIAEWLFHEGREQKPTSAGHDAAERIKDSTQVLNAAHNTHAEEEKKCPHRASLRLSGISVNLQELDKPRLRREMTLEKCDQM